MKYQDAAIVSLSGEDVDKFGVLLDQYPELSRSGLLRMLIRKEYERIIQTKIS